MAKKLFCSYCGMPLEEKAKALKNRAEVIFVIKPHECDEKHLDNITDADKPMHRIDVEAKQVAARGTIPENEVHASFTFSDKRDAAVLRKHSKPVISTAPQSILSMVKQGAATGPERPFKDLDLEDETPDEEA
jgi:hypothetical protein